MKNKKLIAIIALLLLCFGFCQNTFAIEENKPKEDKKPKFSWFKKKSSVEEIKLPEILEGKPKIPFNQLSTMTIDDCVDYAISHNPNLAVSSERIKAAKSGIGQARSNYAPRLTARVNYNHNDTESTGLHTNQDSLGFSAGISEMIWDFGKTTARINMAKYDTESAIYDYDYDVLNVVYNVRINYFKVLQALAHLDIYEQNVRIQTLNQERTQAMFDEGLKSKIDVVNAQVNLTDAKIQLVEGQNSLQTALINLKNSMFYQEDKPFIVKNTENFNFLKTDYKKKVESLTTIKPAIDVVKKNEDGLIMLTSGIEHKDIIQNFEF